MFPVTGSVLLLGAFICFCCASGKLNSSVILILGHVPHFKVRF